MRYYIYEDTHKYNILELKKSIDRSELYNELNLLKDDGHDIIINFINGDREYHLPTTSF